VSLCLARFDPLALMREATARNRAEATAAAEAEADARAPRGRAAGARVRARGTLPVMSARSDSAAGGAAFGEAAAAAAALERRAEEDVAARLGASGAAAATAAEAALAAFSKAGEAEAGGAGGAGGEAVSGGDVIAALRATAAALERDLVERDAEARLLLLALVGGEHLLLLGPPGTAKSELCRRLSRLSGLAYFERTLTRFSTPEELFGPLSLAALERDEYRRATAGYAPEAELLFIDEVPELASRTPTNLGLG
jgi:MoxR-like ATPase